MALVRLRPTWAVCLALACLAASGCGPVATRVSGAPPSPAAPPAPAAQAKAPAPLPHTKGAVGTDGQAGGSRPAATPARPAATATRGTPGAATGFGAGSTAAASTPAAAPTPAPSWQLPDAPAINVLVAPGLVVSEYPRTRQSVVAAAEPGASLETLEHIPSLLATAAGDRQGGFWYVPDGAPGTLVWTDGPKSHLFSWRDATTGGVANDLNVATDSLGGAWLLFVTPTVAGHQPENLLGIGDDGGRTMLVHASLGGTVQRHTLPPLAGTGLAGLAVAPDGTVWFATMEGGNLRVLYSYDPANGTAEPHNLPLLGSVLAIRATANSVWLRILPPGGTPELVQFDPRSGAAAPVLSDVTSMAVGPTGHLFVASQSGGTPQVYEATAAGLMPQGALLPPQAPISLAMSAAGLWALTPGRLYRLGR